MLPRSMPGPILALGLLTSIAGAQQPTTPATSTAISTGRAYKVAFWYEAGHPTTSIKYRAYDLAKGEYDANAVDRWLDLILTEHPDQGAYLRDIRTEGLPGATDLERLANAIENEKGRWAALQRTHSTPLPRYVSPLGSHGPRAGTLEGSRANRPARSSPGGLSNPPASPFPYPYRSRPL